MSKGQVKKYDPNQECGVIIDTDTGEHVTVYTNFINLRSRKMFKKGREVEYEIKNSCHRNWVTKIRVL